jgi:poly-gamma-glutamate capsule biosynthesis protein CapA/YwtB (metallophosphatase superfamily)
MTDQTIRHPLAALAFAVALAGGATPAAAQDAPPSNDPTAFVSDNPKPSTLKGKFILVTIGDLLYSHPMADTPNPEIQKVISLIKSGDVTIANQEGVFIDLKTFKGSAYGDGQLWGEAALAEDIKAMGVDMVSLANNHATDFGWEGLAEAMRLSDQAGLIHAGGGMSLQEARQAGILTTPKGKVALVSVASTFKTNARANDAFGETNARPGISTLRLQTINLVTKDQLEKVRSLAIARASRRGPGPAPDATEVTLGDQIYRLSDKPGLHYDMELYDHAGLLKSIRDAKQAADLVVFTIHAHESPTGMDDDTPEPPDFLIKLFHDAVNAGADVVQGGGPHSLRGIEIYKGRPIFYGQGVFFIKGEIKALQETALKVFPDPSTGKAPPPKPEERSVRPGGNPASWYDSMVAVTDFDNGAAKVVRLYPLDVGNTYDRSRRGNPQLADPENARRILANLQRDSAPFGTRIEIDGTVGVIRIP